MRHMLFLGALAFTAATHNVNADPNASTGPIIEAAAPVKPSVADKIKTQIPPNDPECVGNRCGGTGSG
ncbi:MAG: hypothetical protein HYX35_02140 [Proteobacteria bacterium]|nr:hypothetical protein [Pseudomonadota bacterium]